MERREEARERAAENADRVSIRPAVRSDAPLLAWAVLVSTRGHETRGFMDVRFPFLSEDQLLHLLQQMVEEDTPSIFRWDGFLVAEVKGQPAAGIPRSAWLSLARTGTKL